MTLRKVIYILLSKEKLSIEQLFDKLNEKNDIARATIRGRLSEMVRAGEVKKLDGIFEAVPIKEIKEKITEIEQIKTKKLENPIPN